MKEIKLSKNEIEKELEGLQFLKGLQFLCLDKNEFKHNTGDYGTGIVNDLDCKVIIVDEVLEEKTEALISYTITDTVKEEDCFEKIILMDGYWQVTEM